MVTFFGNGRRQHRKFQLAFELRAYVHTPRKKMALAFPYSSPNHNEYDSYEKKAESRNLSSKILRIKHQTL